MKTILYTTTYIIVICICLNRIYSRYTIGVDKNMISGREICKFIDSKTKTSSLNVELRTPVLIS